MNNKKGFTLIELLAVIVIMGVLMLIAIPLISRIIENSRKDTFVDTAKTYVNAVKNLWAADGLTCEGRISSAVDDGDYYILINTKEGAKEHLPHLLDRGGKSSWGNRNVNGYVRVNVNTTEGNDANGDGIYEVEPKRTIKFYVALSDGTHGIIDDDTKVSDNLVRGDIDMDLTTDNIKRIHLTVDDGKLNCARSEDGIYTCTEVNPVRSITGVCVDDNTYVDVTGNANVNPSSFATDDWNTIITAIRSGNHPYSVGDTKTVELGGKIGTHTVRITNLSSCDTSLESTSACGAVIEFDDIISIEQMNNNNTGDWSITKMRQYLNTTVYNSLPSDLRNGIINTTVVTGHNYNGDTNYVSTDEKIYLLSTKEVWSQGSSNSIDFDTARDSTRQLDYYQGVTTDNYAGAIKQYNGSNWSWWLRTPHAYNTDRSFVYVTEDGNFDFEKANKKLGVSPVFRIA